MNNLSIVQADVEGPQRPQEGETALVLPVDRSSVYSPSTRTGTCTSTLKVQYSCLLFQMVSVAQLSNIIIKNLTVVLGLLQFCVGTLY